MGPACDDYAQLSKPQHPEFRKSCDWAHVEADGLPSSPSPQAAVLLLPVAVISLLLGLCELYSSACLQQSRVVYLCLHGQFAI